MNDRWYFFVTFSFFSLVFCSFSWCSDFVIFMIHESRWFSWIKCHGCVGWKFYARDPVLLFIFLLFWIILPVVENSGVWCLFIIFILFDTGFSFKNIHDSQQGKGETISLTPLYHFHPPHRHLDISQVITADS